MLTKLRAEYHRQICERVLFVDSNKIPNNADKHSDISTTLARNIVKQLGFPLRKTLPSGQTSGNLFELVTAEFIEKAFKQLQVLMVALRGQGNWRWEGPLGTPLGLVHWKRASSPVEARSEEHTSELQSPTNLVCRLLLEKKKRGGERRIAESRGSHDGSPLRWPGYT